jgi:hypothetical protein
MRGIPDHEIRLRSNSPDKRYLAPRLQTTAVIQPTGVVSMSLGARLLASGALGAASGVAVAIGLVTMLTLPSHAQTLRAEPNTRAIEASDGVDVDSDIIKGDLLLGGRQTTRATSISGATEVGQGEADKTVTSAVLGASSARMIATPTRPGTEALVLNGSLNLK